MPTPQNPVFVDAADTIHFLDAPVAWTQPVPTLVAGVATLDGSTVDSVDLSATNASGGVPGAANAYTYQWERKTGSGGTYADVSGANALTLQQAALAPASYFYRLRYTDRLGTVVYSNEVNANLSGLTKILHDEFNGPDTTTLSGRTPDTVNTGTTWQQLFGGVGLTGLGEVYIASAPGLAVIETTKANCEIICDVWLGSAVGRNPHLGLRATDANNYIRVQFDTASNLVRIQTVIAGAVSTLASGAYTLDTLQDFRARVVLISSGIQVFTAPVFTTDYTEIVATASATHNQTATKHGVGGNHNNTGFYDFEVWA